MSNTSPRSDEQEPRTNSVQHKFPTQQLFILALCRISEPIAFMSVFPYAYHMVETFNITQHERRISIYAGMLITAFPLAEFTTGAIWGQVSDRVGRKPVLLTGMLGTTISMICFGFARNLPTAVMARVLGGLLNGNTGVLQTTVAELVTKKEHQPRAFSIMPFVWCLGSIIGSVVGGILAMPCINYPSLFLHGSLFESYPFLLPNLVCTIITVTGIITGILFLEETHVNLRRPRSPLGSNFNGSNISKVSCIGRTRSHASKQADHQRVLRYKSSNFQPSTHTTDIQSYSKREKGKSHPIFDRRIILIIASNCILAHHSVSFDSLIPTFLSEPRSQVPPVLPFKFSGGFGLSTKTIGLFLMVQGIYSMFAQLWIFPFVVGRMGTLGAYRLAITLWPPIYFATPYLILLPTYLQSAGIMLFLLAKITFHVHAFPSNAILLTNAAPSKSVLGTINGFAASATCLARATGPILSGAVHSAGLRVGYNGIAWWMLGFVCVGGALQALYIEETENRSVSGSSKDEEASECLLCDNVGERDEFRESVRGTI